MLNRRQEDMTMNNSFSFSLHENSPSWLEAYYHQINDSAATKRRLQMEREKHPVNKTGDTSISQENYDNSLYTIFFSGEKVHHIHLVHRAAIRHWRHKEISASELLELNHDPSTSYQNLKAVLAGPGEAELQTYEIDQESTYHPPATKLEEDTYCYGMGLDRTCLEVFLTEAAKEKTLHDYFLGKRKRPALQETFNFGPSITSQNQEQTVPDMKLFEQSLLASEVRARAALARIINADNIQFAKLAEDISSDVRMSILENEKCPSEVIEQLCRDANPQVASAAKERLGYL